LKRTFRGIVVAGHAATADAGASILRAGGNAVDAAIAAVSTAFCAEPVLTSAGGGGFMLLAGAQKQPVLYDGFSRMPGDIGGHGKQPASFRPEMKAIPIDFGDTIQTFHIGQASVATPSLMAMLFEAHRRHGKLPLMDALAPGLDAASSGIRLNALQASFIHLLTPILSDTAACKALHAPAGDLYSEGEYFRNTDLANTLEMLAIEGIDEMYHGDLARAMVRACTPHGLLGMKDLAAGQVDVRLPLATPVFGGTLLTNPPPSSGGLLIAFAAGLLERIVHLDAIKHVPMPVLLAEVLRTASALRQAGLDARMYEPGLAGSVLHEAIWQQHVERIIHHLQGEQGAEGNEPANRHGSTTHISIVDRDGMAVSLTTSNGEGSGIVVPGSGIHLNNMLGEEDINPLGFHALATGSRLSSMMAPSILLQDGQVAMVLGSGGSNRLRGAILQVLMRHRLSGQSLEQAVHAPRLHNEGCRLDVEPDALSQHDQACLMQQGWELNPWQQPSVYFGGVHAISCHQGQWDGCGDPRRGGAVCYA